jgi:hypothetical protein
MKNLGCALVATVQGAQTLHRPSSVGFTSDIARPTLLDQITWLFHPFTVYALLDTCVCLVSCVDPIVHCPMRSVSP